MQAKDSEMTQIRSKSPVISVIVPIYNVADYLPRCLDSIVAQTIFSQLEVILVDDGSTDGAAKICQEYVEKYNFIYVYQENQGLSAARNTGLDLATGEYVSFIDSDDAISADFHEFLLKLALEKQVDLVATSVDNKYSNGGIFRSRDNYFANNNKIILIDFLLGKGLVNNAYDKLYKKSLIKQIRFNPRCRYGEDLVFNLEVLLNVSSVYKDRSQGRYFYYYREGSITDGQRPVRESVLSFFYEVEKAFSMISDKEVAWALQRYVLGWYIVTFNTAYKFHQKEICAKLRASISEYDKNFWRNPFIGPFSMAELLLAKYMPFLLPHFRKAVQKIRRLKRR